MRKSGWAAYAGLVSAALLLTACGGSSTSTGATTGNPSSGGAGSSAGSTGSSSGGSTPTTNAASTGQAAAPKSSPALSSPPPGTVYFGVMHTAVGYVLSENNTVVYTFAGDSAGKAPTCTGSCAAQWPPVKSANPQVSGGSNLSGRLGSINGVATYNGLPLYTFKNAHIFTVHANAEWHVIKLSSANVNS